MKKRIKDPADFEWMKQCRFYGIRAGDRDHLHLRRRLRVSYEYLGVKERLVITP